MNIILLLVAVVVFLLLIAILLSYRKKHSLQHARFLGAEAHVHCRLNPEGTVILDGEVWPARSRDGLTLDIDSSVQVVGAQDHVLLVDALHDHSLQNREGSDRMPPRPFK